MATEFVFDSVDAALQSYRDGNFVVVMDDEDRENEGDLIIAAEHITNEKVAFMLRYTSGIVCTPMTAARAEQLDLPPMLANNTDPKKTAFTVTCDVEGTTTGVSAADRALTIKALVDPAAKAGQFRKPGHIFPLVARPGGVLERRGHTEAAVDLCQLSGLRPVGVLCEITNDDGTMSRLKECYALAKEHGLCITTVEALVAYKEALSASRKHYVELLAECVLPIQRQDKYLGEWTMRCYGSHPDGLTRHVALIKGDVASAQEPVLVRVHSECFTSHVVGSRRCDCSQQFDRALEIINEHGCGVVIYVDGHEGRGIGLHNKIKAYSLQHTQHLDTYQANNALGFPDDMRNYDTPRAIIRHLGIQKIAILSNNPTKVREFEDMVDHVVPVICDPHEHNADYLKAKRLYEAKNAASSASLSARRGSAPAASSKLSLPSDWKSKLEDSKIQNNEEEEAIITDPHLSKEIPIELPCVENIAGLRIGLIRTSWNETLVGSLYSKCKMALIDYGVKSENVVDDLHVPGSFELPFAAQRLVQSGRVDAVICFGVLIKGETMHFEYISQAVSQGLMQVQLSTGFPVIYGVLNCLTLEQAAVRCGVSTDSALPQSLAATSIRMAALKKGLDDKSFVLSKPMQQPCAQG